MVHHRADEEKPATEAEERPVEKQSPACGGHRSPGKEAYQERKAQLAGAADQAREVMRGS